MGRIFAQMGIAWGVITTFGGIWMYVNALNGNVIWPESHATTVVVFGFVVLFLYEVGDDMRPNARPILRVTPTRLWGARIAVVCAWGLGITQTVISLATLRGSSDDVLMLGFVLSCSGLAIAFGVQIVAGYAFTTTLLRAWRDPTAGIGSADTDN